MFKLVGSAIILALVAATFWNAVRNPTPTPAVAQENIGREVDSAVVGAQDQPLNSIFDVVNNVILDLPVTSLPQKVDPIPPSNDPNSEVPFDYPPTPGIGPIGKEPEMCIQVIAYAVSPIDGQVYQFPTPCDVPPGWKIVPSAP
jgi:hypothetical protein